MKKVLFAIIPVAILVAAMILPKARKETAFVSQMVAEKQQFADKNQPISPARSEEQPAGIFRKIIQSGEVTLQIQHYERFFQALQKRVTLLGGFVANIQSQRSGESVSSASLTLRIPPSKLQTTLSWLREQGMMTAEHIQSEDISEQYYDLKARMGNARRFETRLLEMLKAQTGNLQDLILVESKLNEVREQIEQMEGKLRYFDALTDLATLTVQVQVESVYVPPVPATFAHRIAGAWHNSVEGLFEVSQSLALLIVALTPWIFPLLLLVVVARFAFRYLWKMFRKPNMAS